MQDRDFEWDDPKAESNRRKHGVSFEEARTAFEDERRITAYDTEHSEIEDRWASIGLSARSRVLVVSYTRRGRRIRIISARRAVGWEQEVYERQWT